MLKAVTVEDMSREFIYIRVRVCHLSYTLYKLLAQSKSLINYATFFDCYVVSKGIVGDSNNIFFW